MIIKIMEKNIGRTSNDLVTFLNPVSFIKLRNFSELDNFEVKIDGILLCWFVRFFLRIPVKRESFDASSLSPKIFAEARSKGWRVAVIGSDPDSIENFVEVVTRRFAGIDICYARNGFFSTARERSYCITEILDLRPDLIIVGMGTGLQEEFLLDVKGAANFRFKGFTCGGYIHQSKKFDFYPEFFNKYNCRIIYRLFKEPNLWKRHIRYYPTFPFIFLYELVCSKVK